MCVFSQLVVTLFSTGWLPGKHSACSSVCPSPRGNPGARDDVWISGFSSKILPVIFWLPESLQGPLKTNNPCCRQRVPPPPTLPPAPSSPSSEFMLCLRLLHRRTPPRPCNAGETVGPRGRCCACCFTRMDLTNRSAPNHTFLFWRPLVPWSSLGTTLGLCPMPPWQHASQNTGE